MVLLDDGVDPPRLGGDELGIASRHGICIVLHVYDNSSS